MIAMNNIAKGMARMIAWAVLRAREIDMDKADAIIEEVERVIEGEYDGHIDAEQRRRERLEIASMALFHIMEDPCGDSMADMARRALLCANALLKEEAKMEEEEAAAVRAVYKRVE